MVILHDPEPLYAAGLAAVLSGLLTAEPVVLPWDEPFVTLDPEALVFVGVRRHVPADVDRVRAVLAGGVATIVMGVPSDDRDVIEFVRTGVHALPRDCGVPDLVLALEGVTQPVSGQHLRSADRHQADPSRPTPRELEVAGLLAQGMTNRQIAKHLVISENTVRNHLGHIYAKLGVTSRTQAVLRAGQLGWLRLPQ